MSQSAHESPAGDEHLVRQSIQGSRQAFGLLVVRHARMVRAICMAKIGLRELDDAVQEVFLRAFRGLQQLKDPGRFASYLSQIARNHCTDRLRAAGAARAAVSLDEVALEPAAPQRADDGRASLLARLRREVGRLSESQREVVLLFYFERLSYAQMAARLDVTEAAVNQRLSRARQQLRAAFAQSREASP